MTLIGAGLPRRCPAVQLTSEKLLSLDRSASVWLSTFHIAEVRRALTAVQDRSFQNEIQPQHSRGFCTPTTPAWHSRSDLPEQFSRPAGEERRLPDHSFHTRSAQPLPAPASSLGKSSTRFERKRALLACVHFPNAPGLATSIIESWREIGVPEAEVAAARQ